MATYVSTYPFIYHVSRCYQTPRCANCCEDKMSLSLHVAHSSVGETQPTLQIIAQSWQRNKVRDKELLCPASGVEGRHVLLRTSGVEATRGDFSGHRRSEKEGAFADLGHKYSRQRENASKVWNWEQAGQEEDSS